MKEYQGKFYMFNMSNMMQSKLSLLIRFPSPFSSTQQLPFSHPVQHTWAKKALETAGSVWSRSGNLPVTVSYPVGWASFPRKSPSTSGSCWAIVLELDYQIPSFTRIGADFSLNKMDMTTAKAHWVVVLYPHLVKLKISKTNLRIFMLRKWQIHFK